MKTTHWLLATSLFAFSGLVAGTRSGVAQPGVAQPGQPAVEVLTLQKAIALAIQNQPAIRSTKSRIEAANAQVDIAHVIQRPTLTLNAAGSVGSRPARPCIDNPQQICNGFFQPGAQSTLSAQFAIRIYDFGLTKWNIRAAELAALATATTQSTLELDIRATVEAAYLEAVARARLVKVAEATVQSEELHLDQARRFVAAQAKDPIEVAQAQSRAANAKSALAQAQAQNAIALANLRAAIGWLDPTRSPVVDSAWPAPSPTEAPPTLDALVGVARKHRPELVQFDRQIQSGEASVIAAEHRNRPVLSANVQTNWNPDSINWQVQPNWAAGFALSWQIFDGGRAKAEARLARANVNVTRADRDNLLVTLTSQLDSARSLIIANSAAVNASNEAVTAARAQLKLADARYTQGLGSQIELADAQFAVTTAEGNLVQAQWQLAAAWTQLRRAVGEI